MPNIDAGHYFLTVLLPIRRDPVEIYDHIVTTPMLAVREWLAGLPTAHQSPVCVSTDNSPFARNLRNHFARFSVIDVPAFNGRIQTDAVVMALRKINPVVPQPVDQLSTPYLFFSADFNCIHGDDRDLDSYLATLWATMEPEIRKIFQYCYGFETVESTATFTAFIKRGQVETTMPFHDYWIDTPNLPTLTEPWVAGTIGAVVLVLLVWFVVGLIRLAPLSCWLLFLAAVAGAVFGLYKFIMARGAKPFPAAVGADLSGVLKSLYLQKQFTRFAIDNQGADPAALHTAFADFLQTHQPTHVSDPTQAPGVIGA